MVAWGLGALMQKAAATAAAGFALQNATPVIVSWTAPADGQPHRVMIITTIDITALETGGQVSATFTAPDGAVQNFNQLFAAGQAAAAHTNQAGIIVAPGTTVTLSQTSALTAGAALIWAEIWAS